MGSDYTEDLARELLELERNPSVPDSEVKNLLVDVQAAEEVDMDEVGRIAGVIDVSESLPEGVFEDISCNCRGYGWELAGNRLDGVDESDNREVVEALYGFDNTWEKTSSPVYTRMRMNVGTFIGDIPRSDIPEVDVYMGFEPRIWPEVEKKGEKPECLRLEATDKETEAAKELAHDLLAEDLVPEEAYEKVHTVDIAVNPGTLYITSRNMERTPEVLDSYLDTIEGAIEYAEQFNEKNPYN